VYARMAAAARQRAATFAPERFAEQVLGAFGELLPLAPRAASVAEVAPAPATHHELVQA